MLFDLDDTLCDYVSARDRRLREAFTTAFAGAGGIAGERLEALVAASIAEAPHGGAHFPEFLARHGLEDRAAGEAARDWFAENRFLGLALFPAAVDVLRAVRGTRGAGARRVGLVTNGPAEVQRDKIGLLGLWGHVDFAVISGELGVEKPDPAIFREALRLGGATAEATIYVGDSPDHDVAGARAAGIWSVWHNPAGLPWPRAEEGPDHVIRGLWELEGVLGEG